MFDKTGNTMLMDSGILHLYGVSFVDAGSYWCAATNHITTETYMANWATQLVVKAKASAGARKPPEFLIKPKQQYVVPQG